VQSEALDRLNAAHIAGPQAADFVLLHWEPVRARHPLFEDPLSWRALLERYELVFGEPERLLLRRTTAPRFGPPQPAGSTHARFGEAIELPQTPGLLLMAVDIRPNWQGLLRNLLFRTDPVLYEATYESGEKAVWRAMRASLTGGVIVSHLPQDQADLGSLFRGDLQALGRVRSIRFFAERLNQYQPAVEVRWLTLPLTHSSVPPPPIRAARVPLWLPSGPQPQAGDAERPAFRFDLGPDFNRFPTLIIRARFEKPGRLQVFFGREKEGGQLKGRIPEGGRWFDIYVSASHNPFWPGRDRIKVRYDPSSKRPAPAAMEIAGIWGIAEAAADAAPEVQVLESGPRP
jgi:hypothetical protein